MGCGLSKPKPETDLSNQLEYYNPVRYVPDAGQIRSSNRVVRYVHFVAHTILQTGGNHWTLFLQTRHNESVRITMDPGDLLGAPSPGHGYRGQMEISLRAYALTREHQHVVTIPATGGHTVAHFIDAIIAAGNDEYDFTTEGRGCTGWMLDQYRLFLQKGLIQPGSDLEDAIAQAWAEGRATGPQRVTAGFYMRDTRGGGWGRRSRGGR